MVLKNIFDIWGKEHSNQYKKIIFPRICVYLRTGMLLMIYLGLKVIFRSPPPHLLTSLSKLSRSIPAYENTHPRPFGARR